MPIESNLFKEAIADAKAVRQTALANAKVALEEAFSERYQAMFSEKLREDAAQDTAPSDKGVKSSAEDVSEQEIDELIKELESEVSPEGGAPAPEAPIGGEQGAEGGAPAPEAPIGGEPHMVLCPVGTVATAEMPPAPPAGMGAPGAAPVPPMGAPGAAPVPPMGAPGAAPVPGSPVPPSDVPPSGEETDEDVNLDELLESLKEEVEKEEKEEEEESIDEQTKLSSSAIGGKTGGSDNKKPSASAHNSSKIESGGMTDNGMPDSKVESKDATDAKRPNEAKNATSTNLSTPSFGGASGPALKAARPNSKGEFEGTTKLSEENVNLKKQLEEATDTIKYVKGQLNEINLLNAKLLYTNKLFKEYNMNNEHKMRIVEMFDLSKNVREVKLTYANIAESLNFSGGDVKRKMVTPSVSNAQSITEGLASKPVGSTKPSKEILSESKSSAMVAQFQKLAGIKKS
jgi:hypothetical protein